MVLFLCKYFHYGCKNRSIDPNLPNNFFCCSTRRVSPDGWNSKNTAAIAFRPTACLLPRDLTGFYPSGETRRVYICGMEAIVGSDLRRAAAILEAGELVAIPTETVYGLAANALDAAAVAKIFEVKNRPQFNPLIVHLANLERLKALDLHFPDQALALAEKFSPGPITFLIPTSPKIPSIVTSGTSAVAVRIPGHPMTLELLNNLPFPLAAPSANLSGRVSTTTPDHVKSQLGNKISYILDGGAATVGIESTIISFTEKKPRILRFGGISKESIENIIGEVTEPDGGFADNPIAPGMLAKHYATRHPLVIGDISQLVSAAHQLQNIPRIAIIALQKTFDAIPAAYQFQLSASGNLTEAASRLFAAMQLIDDMDIDLVLTEKFPDQGLGRAINDRLLRASIPSHDYFNQVSK
jgi:L-threonylcarbamoyladenylate synthase